jgi:hypothetical protein
MANKPKRPRDVNQLAKMIVDLSTGEKEPESLQEPGKGRDAKVPSKDHPAIAKKASRPRSKKA